jgi:hypothetical protein
LTPVQPFGEFNIRAGLPSPERFGLQHLRCCARKHL